jgi:hypothetical protein
LKIYGKLNTTYRSTLSCMNMGRQEPKSREVSTCGLWLCLSNAALAAARPPKNRAPRVTAQGLSFNVRSSPVLVRWATKSMTHLRRWVFCQADSKPTSVALECDT